MLSIIRINEDNNPFVLGFIKTAVVLQDEILRKAKGNRTRIHSGINSHTFALVHGVHNYLGLLIPTPNSENTLSRQEMLC